MDKYTSKSGNAPTADPRQIVVGKQQKMENETLLEGLHNILDDYRDGSQILREMVQNAEDAGASCFKIYYDKRLIDPGISLDISHYFKGPGLCVYNDAIFKENDWKGIKKIGASWKRKEKEKLKIGRFGQGFKSVFHITDYVIVLSGKELLIIDPLKSEDNEKECLSVTLKSLADVSREHIKKTLQIFQHKFNFDVLLLEEQDPSYKGTLFWLAFRTQESQLSQMIYTNDKVKLLLQQFGREMPLVPLFLTHIKLLEILELDGGVESDAKLLHRVTKSDRNNSEMTSVEHEVEKTKELPNETKMSISKIEISNIEIDDDHEENVYWTVANCIFGLSDMSEKMKLLSGIDSFSFTPMTSIAYCNKTCVKSDVSGHIFCFLPLPLSSKTLTGLPVHLNGFFALEHNRCYIKYKSKQDQQNSALEWNHGLIQELFPRNYFFLLRQFREDCIAEKNEPALVDEFYELIPDPEKVDINWHPMLAELFTHVFNEPIFYTDQNNGQWVNMNDALPEVYGLIPPDDTTRSVLQSFLLKCKKNLSKLPEHFKNIFSFMSQQVEQITPASIRKEMKKNECWKKFSNDEKLSLLDYILLDKVIGDLHDIELLPLSDGSFLCFTEDNDDDIEHKFLLANDEELRMFPGIESKFVCRKNISEMTWTSLQCIAEEGHFQLKVLTNEDIPTLLKSVFKTGCLVNDSRYKPHNEVMRSQDWVENVWRFIIARQFENLNYFLEVPIIPIISSLKAKGIKKVEYYLYLKGNYMFSSYGSLRPLTDTLQKILRTSGLVIINPENTISVFEKEVVEKHVMLPTPENIIQWFASLPSGISDKINQLCTDIERCSLAQYLKDHANVLKSVSKDFFKMLNLFYQTDNLKSLKSMSPFNQNIPMLTILNFPNDIAYPKLFLENKYRDLFAIFGGIEMEENTLYNIILDNMLQNHQMYSQNDKRKFMIFLSKHQGLDVSVLTKAKKLKFIPTESGCYCCVQELFDPTSPVLQDLFTAEKDRFPDKSFMKENNFSAFLKVLGLKTESDLTSSTMLEVAERLSEDENLFDNHNILTKATAFLKFLLDKNEMFSEDDLLKIKQFNWVPVLKERPSDYISSLKFYGECLLTPVCSPIEIKSSHMSNLVGSVKPLITNISRNNRIAKVYQWFDEPEIKDVIQHFKNVLEVYTENQNSKYVSLSRDIFQYLNKRFEDGSDTDNNITKALCQMRCIPTNQHGFKSPSQTVLNLKCRDVVLPSLEPFIFTVAEEFTSFKNLLLNIGVHSIVSFDILESILWKMNEKHKKKSKNKPNEQRKDRKLAVDILRIIAEMDIEKKILLKLYVPIRTLDDILAFDRVDNCTFADQQKLVLIDESDIIFSHPDINEIANQLGIATITTRALKKNSVFIPWGQSKPLTTEIADNLEGYADGFSIPKELFQNADDAGATKISFIYDERQNYDSREGLFDKGMGECHGEALWVFNDAAFLEKDFDNILKLGGRTKQHEKDKIGKFGLGFCSVYNLTDVPSLISGNTLVVLDPHLHHLGDAIQNGNPGVRVAITKDILKIYRNQFKPFEGISGINFSDALAGKGDFEYRGTLFRLPFRTSLQATNSKIRSTQYNKDKIILLLDKLMTDASNLLLFAESVKEIQVYHLDSKCTNPEQDLQLMFKTVKTVQDSSEKSFLRKVVHSSYQRQLSEFQLVDIKVETTEDASRLLANKSPFTGEQTYLLSWNTGRKSFDLAEKLKEERAIPVGSVAVPVKRHGKKIKSLIDISKVPTGFYQESHMFCFLPLPSHIPLPVHINGCFLVQRDRKTIVTYNEDSTTYQVNCAWNDTMLTDIIMNAYVEMFSYVISNLDSPNNHNCYWTMWPFISHDQDINKLIYAFYDYIISHDPCVFFRLDMYTNQFIRTSFRNSAFLDPIFRAKSKRGDIAFECLIKFHENSEIKVMDMPKNVHEMIQRSVDKSNKDHEDRFISKFDFFKNYFLPSLTNDYWNNENTITNRNELLKEGLEDIYLHDLIQSVECIPVKESNLLRKPCELVYESGRVSTMFEMDDHRYPKEEFENFKDTLIQMGMMDSTVQPHILFQRASSLRRLSEVNHDEAVQRYRATLKYLGDNIEIHINDVGQMKTIPFIPIMKRPDGWPETVPWKGEDEQDGFKAPKDVFLPEFVDLKGAVRLIAGSSDHVDTRILKLVGVQDVNTQDVVEQLIQLGKSIKTDSTRFKDIIKRVYSYLNTWLDNGEAGICSLKSTQMLKKDSVVYINGVMINCEKVAMSLDGNCSPYLYQIDYSMREFDKLWSFLGISENFDISVMTKILQQKKDELGAKPLSTGEIKCIVNILKNICKQIKNENRDLTADEKDTIVLPDSCGILRQIKEVCFDDGYIGITPTKHEFFYVHKTVVTEFGLIETLKVSSKRQLHLNKFANVLPFGQKEKLVNRIKGIISAYPMDHSILNELLQNADDAGASEVHVVYDMRNHRTKHIFSEKWAQFQGPALTFFNNAWFSDNDLKKIQDLGVGSKHDDPLKIGQFGIGFNAVYHLTDVPSFITKGPSKDTFCVFDPHCRNVPSVDEDSPGFQFDNLGELKRCYLDVYDAHLQTELPSNYGTWFRIPLRTYKQAEKSDISNKSIEEKDVNEILKTMKKKMEKSLLFLTNVNKISLSYIKPGDKSISDTYSVSVEMSDEDLKTKKDFKERIKLDMRSVKQGDKRLRDINFREIKYETETNVGNRHIDKWLVVQGFGFPNSENVPAKIDTCFQDKSIILSPIGGVAKHLEYFNLKTRRAEQGSDQDCTEAFCSLPLPINTGLPVHVNGHFALNQNRAQIFRGNFKDDIRYAWNTILVTETIAHTYSSLLQAYKNKVKNCTKWHELSNYFQSFPRCLSAKEDIWKDLTFATFNSIIRRQLSLFPVCPAYMKHECSEHSFQDKNKHKDNFEIRRWVPLEKEQETFPAFFDFIKSFYEVKIEQKYQNVQRFGPSWASTSIVPCTFEVEHKLREVLIDIGMKLICCPKNIFESIESSCHHKNHIKRTSIMKSSLTKKDIVEKTAEEATIRPVGCICQRSINPEAVISFLKTWNLKPTECVVGNLSSLDNSQFKTIDRLVHVLKFCMRQCADTIEPIVGLPLLIKENEAITPFDRLNELFLTEYSDLLPASPEKFVHTEQVQHFKKFENYFRAFDLNGLSTLLSKSLSNAMYRTNGPIDMYLDLKIYLERLWEYFNTQDVFSDNNELREWCLVPCRWNSKDKLVSMQQAYCLFVFKQNLFQLDSYSSTFREKYISKLALPCPNLEITGRKHIYAAVASIEQPEKLIDCLYYHRQTINWTELEQPECEDLLLVFAGVFNTLTPHNFEKLKCLQIFTTVTGNIETIDGSKQVLVVKNSDCSVVSDGIDDICAILGTKLLVYNKLLEHLFAKLGCIPCYERKKKKKGYRNPLVSLYTRFILPNFHLLKRKHHMPHLEFIRDELLESEEVQKLLRSLKFIPDEVGSLRCASTFFSPRVELFAELCTQTEIPPEPFSAPDWDKFMEFAGIEKEISEIMILRFASDIQRNGLYDKSETHSRILLENMFKLSNLKGRRNFLTKISAINFITCQTIDNDYVQICRAYSPNGLVSFQSAEHPRNASLCWTIKAILPEYAIPVEMHTQKMLQVSEIPNMQSVISHIHLVCEALNNPSFIENRQIKRKFIKDLMQEFYAYLSTMIEDKVFCSEAKVRFSQTPLIYNVENKRFHVASYVVLTLPKELEIPSFLSSCSECYGAYFGLFRLLGASDGLSLNHYFGIMKNLKQAATSKKLNVTELDVFEQAFNGLLHCLSTYEGEIPSEADYEDLYLLNEYNVLKLARDLVAVDDTSYKTRIGKTDTIDFLCDLRPLLREYHNIYEILLKLPATNRPTLLSKCLTEDVLMKELAVTCDLANQIESYLAGDNCKYTVIRLLKTYQEKQNVRIDDREYKLVLEKLNMLRVIALPNLQTILIYKEQAMEKCIKKLNVFFVKEENTFYIQYNKNCDHNWILKNSIWFAFGIKMLTDFPISSVILSSVIPFFGQTREELGEMLDYYGLVNADYVFKEMSWFPLPGTPLLDEDLNLVLSDFEEFKPGDHAVCEIYDVDTNIGGEDTSMYIYVKILKQLTTDVFPIYIVNSGEELEQEIPSYRLYKLIRNDNNMSKDVEAFTDGHASRESGQYENVFQTVEEILVDACREGVDVFKHIVRRLYLRWHPDKNDNSAFCGKVFKHLTEFIKKLQNGDIDVSKIDAHREKGREAWNNYLRRATGKGNVVKGYQFDVDGYSPHIGRQRRMRSTGHTNGVMPNPQPHMGRVWMKQAKFDMEAARSSLKIVSDKTYNWVCVQSHQAAEKALKAVQVTEDFTQVGNDHFLPMSVARKFPALQEAVQKLENLVVNYSRMRYPRVTSYPFAPSELYSREQAEESVKLAAYIVNFVSENLL